MTTTKIRYNDVLTATDGRLLGDMDGVYKVFDAVAGPGVTTMSLTHLGGPVKARLREKHPWTTSPVIKDAIDKAAEEFTRLREEAKRLGGNEPNFTHIMDKHVLPLAPSEYIDVEHVSDAEMGRLLDGYGPHLQKILKDKQVVVAVLPDEGVPAE